MQRGFGDARLFDQALQREELVLGRDHFEQREQAQRRRVAVDAGSSVGRGMCVHVRPIIVNCSYQDNTFRFFDFLLDVGSSPAYSSGHISFSELLPLSAFAFNEQNPKQERDNRE